MNDYEKLLYKSNRQKHQLKILQDKCRKYNFTINNLQSKIDKAIEYIETNKHFEWHTIRNEKGKLDTAKIATDWVSGNELLDILKEDK